MSNELSISLIIKLILIKINGAKAETIVFSEMDCHITFIVLNVSSFTYVVQYNLHDEILSR